MVCQQNCVARPLLCPFHRYLVWANKECVYCKQDCEVQIEVGIAIFSSYIFSKCLFEKILSTAVAAAFIEKKKKTVFVLIKLDTSKYSFQFNVFLFIAKYCIFGCRFLTFLNKVQLYYELENQDNFDSFFQASSGILFLMSEMKNE